MSVKKGWKTWGDAFLYHLDKKGEDHGSAAFAADLWERQQKQRQAMYPSPFDLNREKPSFGGRYLVWDVTYKMWVICYWHRPGQFEEWHDGNCRPIQGSLWYPVPPDQE